MREEKRDRKTLVSRGVVISLDRTNGNSVIRTFDRTVSLTRAESILWFAARFAVVSEQELADRYISTIQKMGINESQDVTKPFLSLLDKGCITFGSAASTKDAIYRMLCQGVLMASSHKGYRGNNSIRYNTRINFEPVYQTGPIEVPDDAMADAEYIAQMVANDTWTFPELVRNVANNYSSEVTREDVLRGIANPNSKVIELFPQENKPVLLKEQYYQTDVGRTTAVTVARLILSRRVILM